MAESISFSQVFCPAPCGKAFSGPSKEIAMKIVKDHVALAHPEWDPEWWVEYNSTDRIGG